MRQIAITVLMTVDDAYVQQVAGRAMRARPTTPAAAEHHALEGLRAELECRVSDAVRMHNGVVPGAGITTKASIVSDQPSDLAGALQA